MEKLQEITADYQNNPYVIFSPLPVVVNSDIEVSIGKMPEGFTTGTQISHNQYLNYVIVQPKNSSPENITSFDIIYPFADNRNTIPVAYVGTYNVEIKGGSTTKPESVFFNSSINDIYGKVVFFNQSYAQNYAQENSDLSHLFEYGSFPDRLQGNSVYDLSEAPAFLSYMVIIPPYGINPDFNWADTSQEAIQEGHKNVFKFIIKNYVEEPQSPYHPFEFYIDTNGKSDTPVFNAFSGDALNEIANNVIDNSPFNAFNFAETTTTVNFSGGPAILQIITGVDEPIFG